ncbi:MAG TPA: hypothetical protein VF507_10325 [Pyrinomonadaceae bacterium]|jgi:hypothetical protein
MNCRKFETTISDLAREQLVEASERESALAHAGDCADCAARLNDEKALTKGLRALSASFAECEAPARVEASLLAALRERDRGAVPAPAVVEFRPAARRSTYWPVGAAIAAMILLALALNGASLLRRNPVGNEQQAVNGSQKPPVQVKSPDDFPAGVTRPAVAGPSDEQRPGYSAQPQYLKASLHSFDSRRGQRFNSRGLSRPASAEANEEPTEVASDFMPLTYDGASLPMDSGHMVRVEVPRSALASMGLPVNIERSNETVKADVLYGEDGIARAIRFIR